MSEPQAGSSVFLVYTGTTQDYHLGSILITRLSRRAQKNAKLNLSDPHSSHMTNESFDRVHDIKMRVKLVSFSNTNCI